MASMVNAGVCEMEMRRLTDTFKKARAAELHFWCLFLPDSGWSWFETEALPRSRLMLLFKCTQMLMSRSATTIILRTSRTFPKSTGGASPTFSPPSLWKQPLFHLQALKVGFYSYYYCKRDSVNTHSWFVIVAEPAPWEQNVSVFRVCASYDPLMHSYTTPLSIV